MVRPTITKLAARLASRSVTIVPAVQRSSSSILSRRAAVQTLSRTSCTPFLPYRSFSGGHANPKGLSPESEEPAPSQPEEHYDATARSPAELSQSEYNELADTHMDVIVAKLEDLQEDREDVDVEYSAGVLTLVFPPLGTYVINKQPPNKQIWLSSPISGPKRFDYVIFSEGQNAKADSGAGEWVYLRDGTTLNSILLKEVGVDVSAVDDLVGLKCEDLAKKL
ncbi:mitochondrial iron uptake protein [Phlyctema vagabunda]|uniref:ferroxidase n=1 Tax=Phlyctema vagabunda TaxID=108571 RepID=A0ABR4PTE4_9HELO